MSRRSVPTPPAPDVRSELDGLPYWLWLPDGPRPWPAMVICHGAGSGKPNHADFARVCRGRGWAALTYDARGHGEAREEMGPGALGDVARMARLLAETDGVDRSRICVRGSSMGGFMAIHAAATSDLIAGAIAICPAGEEHLASGFRADRFDGIRISDSGREAMLAWLAELDLRDAVELMGSKPLLLAHAQGDTQIPSEWSLELYGRASDPRKLLLLPGGSHTSVQHDAEIQEASVRWLERNLRR
ncbi:alpha/beta fold hydrolase [Thermoleophilia bacterium SCSIO 60948]|nr:alpha/beta fold hydrolase [Thermoleophilia bacterium SCSIO 60948]